MMCWLALMIPVLLLVFALSRMLEDFQLYHGGLVGFFMGVQFVLGGIFEDA